jgi:GNAT superfamily N-acetyltransferase
LAYADARCLVAYDDQDNAVAAVTVWSAGPGKPGLLEPMGVHQDHRGHRYGTAISVAAAAALQQLGVVVRARMHRELQCRRCRHLRVSRLPAPPAEAGHLPDR